MIHLTLNFLSEYLNRELNLKLGRTPEADSVITSPVNKDSVPDNKIHLTLINIEEEKILKNQDYHRKISPDSDFQAVINPGIKVNLYILASAQFEEENYLEALKQISFVIAVFQGKNLFNQPDLPDYAKILETIRVELYSQSIEQGNLLWQAMGSNLVPSVMYKVRSLLIQDDKILDEAPEVKVIDIKLKKKP